MTANAIPEPFSNIFLSTLEDVFTIVLAALAAFHPIVVLGIILVFILVLTWYAPRVLRAIRRMLKQAGTMLGFGRASA